MYFTIKRLVRINAALRRTFYGIGLLSLLTFVGHGSVRLDQIYCSHMVLQRNVKLPVRGTGEPGQTITVDLASQFQTTVVDAKGTWELWLNPIPAGGPFVLTAKDAGSQIRLEDVLIGDVWVASGQSNMEWLVRQSLNGYVEATLPVPPQVRIWNGKQSVSDLPETTTKAEWTPCDVESIRSFSAIAFFFGRILAEKTKIPIGLISESKGASPIEAWVHHDVLMSDPDYRAILQRWDETINSYPGLMRSWNSTVAEREIAHQKAVSEAKDWGWPIPGPKTPPPGPGSFRSPSGLYNAMINPLISLPIKGVIWYQGESNVGFVDTYTKLFPALIRDWRRRWNCGEFPFLYVQLTSFNFYRPVMPSCPTDSMWARMREAQAAARDAVPNTWMISTMDLGEPMTIHPVNKLAFGKRLADLALNKVYGLDVVCEGPRYASYCEAEDGVDIKFSETGSGLCTSDGQRLRGFAVADDDRNFVWTEARVASSTDVRVLLPPGLHKITAVRYNWGDFPGGNLASTDGLPAEPFRTDKFPATPVVMH